MKVLVCKVPDWVAQLLSEDAAQLLYETKLDEESAVLESVLDDYNEEMVVGMNRLRGRLLGLIESFRLEPRHEQALKATLKTCTYDLQASLSEKFSL